MDVHVHVYRCCVDAENEEEMPEIMRERLKQRQTDIQEACDIQNIMKALAQLEWKE